MLILLYTSTGNVAHVDSVTETGGTLSIYSSLESMLNGESPLFAEEIKATPAEYQALTLYAEQALNANDLVLKSVVNGEIVGPPIDLPDPATEDTDWIKFYDNILITNVFQSIRMQALSSLPLTLSLVEFSAAVSDAKAGRPNLPAISAAISNVVATATLSLEELAELYDTAADALLPAELLQLLAPPEA